MGEKKKSEWGEGISPGKMNESQFISHQVYESKKSPFLPLNKLHQFAFHPKLIMKHHRLTNSHVYPERE